MSKVVTSHSDYVVVRWQAVDEDARRWPAIQIQLNYDYDLLWVKFHENLNYEYHHGRRIIIIAISSSTSSRHFTAAAGARGEHEGRNKMGTCHFHNTIIIVKSDWGGGCKNEDGLSQHFIVESHQQN